MVERPLELLGSEWLRESLVDSEVVSARPESHCGWSDVRSELPGRGPEGKEERALDDLILSVV